MDWWKVLKSKTAADPFAGTALVLSLISLVVSGGSYLVSRGAANDAHAQFQQERQLVLKGKFADPMASGCSDIFVAPIADGFQFQGGQLVLPGEIYGEPINISIQGQVRFSGKPCNAISQYSTDKIRSKISPDHTGVAEGDIPVFVKSFYAVKGESYNDISLYILRTTISVPHEANLDPTILFSGLSFAQRMPANKPADLKFLDELASSEAGFHMEAKSP